MKRRKQLLLTILCLCMGLFVCVCALAVTETDEEGGVWDYDNGTYTAPDGTVYPITPEGVPEDDSSSGQNAGGGSNTDSGSGQNSDGGMEVPSGEGGTPGEPEATRAPLEGADWQAVLDRAAARTGRETPTVWTDPSTGETTEVEVVYMGLGRSMIKLDGNKVMVNTVDLKWQTDAPEDKVLATVDAPRVGYAWLRKAPSNSIKNAKLLQIRTGSVLRVISTGDNWTLVDYEGLRGYVQTSSLEFYLNDHTDFETGFVSLKGKITGKETVHARSRDKGCRDLGEYRLGTPVAVFDIIDEWAEVDIGGWHCRILAQYVTLEKELASAQ